MTKKSYVLKVLEKVKAYRAQAEMIYDYLLTNDDEEYIAYLYEKCTAAVETVMKEKDSNRIKALSDILSHIHQKEEEAKKADEADIEKLEIILSSL